MSPSYDIIKQVHHKIHPPAEHIFLFTDLMDILTLLAFCVLCGHNCKHLSKEGILDLNIQSI